MCVCRFVCVGLCVEVYDGGGLCVEICVWRFKYV